jgi:hypothetical protein
MHKTRFFSAQQCRARAECLQAGLLKTKNRFYSKGSEQCIKRVFFPPGNAELEPSAFYLASSSSGASAFLCLNKQVYSSNY